MISLTRLDGKEIVVNADLILSIEATPDTVLTLAAGGHLMVREPPEEVVERAAAWRRRCASGPRAGAVVPLVAAAREEG